jgi:hypothetical protein
MESSRPLQRLRVWGSRRRRAVRNRLRASDLVQMACVLTLLDAPCHNRPSGTAFV